MKRQSLRLLAVMSLFLVGLASCLPLLDREDGALTATPVAADNQLVYTAPYRAVLREGETVPGAQLQYVGQGEDGIQVRIDGEDVLKKIGDSFSWRGSPAPGVELDFNLRVVGVYLGAFQAWGDVGIIVSEPAPVVTELPDDAPLSFSMAVATHTVSKGEFIPGTTYSYLGKSDKGAEFGGVAGYAYRELADSLDWSGRVRSNVYVDLTMRVSAIHDEEVKLVGTAAVWVFP